jgi:hypothetical protein
MIEMGPKREDHQARQYASPQRGNPNFAWVQHFIYHLAPFFFRKRNTDATRRDQHEETGIALCVVNELRP